MNVMASSRKGTQRFAGHGSLAPNAPPPLPFPIGEYPPYRGNSPPPRKIMTLPRAIAPVPFCDRLCARRRAMGGYHAGLESLFGRTHLGMPGGVHHHRLGLFGGGDVFAVRP